MASNPFKVHDIKVLKKNPHQDEARRLMKRIADQVEPIMRAHRWRVNCFQEFFPKNAGLLGMNVNRTKIFIRLRPSRDPNSFIPYHHLLGTMLHELVHMQISPHSAQFYKLLDELTSECEKLISDSVTGRNMPFVGSGSMLGRAGSSQKPGALGGRRGTADGRGTTSFGTSGQRLGGRVGSAGTVRDLRLRILNAAERRRRDQNTCHAVVNGEDQNPGEAKSRVVGARGGATSSTTMQGIGLNGDEPTREENKNQSSARSKQVTTLTDPTSGNTLSRGQDGAASGVCTSARGQGGAASGVCTSARGQDGATSGIHISTSAVSLNPTVVIDVCGSPPPVPTTNSLKRVRVDSPAQHKNHGNQAPPRAHNSKRRLDSGYCTLCTFLNALDARCCENCGASLLMERQHRGLARVPVQRSWECPVCTLHNKLDHLQCAACGEVKRTKG